MGKHDRDVEYTYEWKNGKKGYRLMFFNHKLVEDTPHSAFKNDIFCARSYFFNEKETNQSASIIVRGFDGYKEKHLDLDYVFKMLEVIDPMTSRVCYIMDRIKAGIESNDISVSTGICIDIHSDRIEITDSLGNDKITIESNLIMKPKKKREKAALKEALTSTAKQNAQSGYQAAPADPMGDAVLLAEGYKSGM